MSSQTDPLAILFGSQSRVKLLRFFLFNPTQEFPFDDISRRARLVRRTARTELSALERAGVIKKKRIYVPVEGSSRKVKSHSFFLNEKFPQLSSLQKFLFETAPIDSKTLLRHARKAGTLDVVVAAGVFIREFDQRLDVLIAMKNLNEQRIESAMRGLEAEIGIGIRFAAMSTEDLQYRLSMYDKLTRDVFDYPHKILTDKIGVQNELLQKGSTF